VLRNGRRGLRHIDNGRLRCRLRRALDELATTIERAGRIANQTRARLAGQAPEGVTRLVSLHDPDAGRSARAASTGRSSSATRRRSSTTTTASSWTTPSNPAAHRPSPRAVTADRGYGEAASRTVTRPRRRSCGDPAQGQDVSRATRSRTPTKLPPTGQMAHRIGGPDQLPQTLLGMGSGTPRRTGRRRDLVRARRVRTQPDQDQRPHRLTEPHRGSDTGGRMTFPRKRHPAASADRLLQVEVANGAVPTSGGGRLEGVTVVAGCDLAARFGVLRGRALPVAGRFAWRQRRQGGRL
jgi:hypothetical protein